MIRSTTAGRTGAPIPAASFLCALAVALLAMALVPPPASAGPHKPKQPLATFPDPEPKSVMAMTTQIEQELYVNEQKTIALQFALENNCCVNMQFVWYPSGRNLVPGYVFTAKTADKGVRHPAVILLHGGFHQHFDVEWFPLVRGLVEHGYVVMFPEYHGSRGYGPEIFTNDYGHSDVDDTIAAAHYIVTKPYVDGSRIAIAGESRGGMITLLAIERAPKLFKAAIDVVGLTDFVAYMAYKPEYRRQEVAREKGFGGKLPFENLGAYMYASPINYVAKIEAPLLVLSNKGDEIAPMQLHTGRLIELLKLYKKTYDAKIYENVPGGHVFLHGDTPQRADAYGRIYAWLGQYLNPGE